MLIEGCKHQLEVTVPADDIERETAQVIADLQKKVRLPGFRPGKAPASIIRSRFANEVRQDVLERVVPKAFQKRVQEEQLNVVGVPNVKDVHFHDNEPLTFTAQFEVAPVIELKHHRGVAVHYHEPEVTDEDVEKRLEEIRDDKAQFVNVDPRPAADGDYAVVTLDSVAGIEPSMRKDDLTIRVGDSDQLPEFTQALLGMSPEDEREFDVTYPADYAQSDLAGKTVRFRIKLKMLRMKELPELNDEFAKDLGDFDTLDQLRDTLRKTIFREREFEAQQEAKAEVIDKLIAAHDFPVPEAFLERQSEIELESQVRQATGKAVDVRKLKENMDWDRFKEQVRLKVLREVKASLLIDRVAEVESLYATQQEVDQEVQRIARQQREPVAAVRKRLEKNGVLARIAHRIRADKALNLLFEHARKEA